MAIIGTPPHPDTTRGQQAWDPVVYESARRAGYLLARHLGCSADDAMDAVQEASERAWRYRGSLDGRFEPWFLAIVHRTATRPRIRWLPLGKWDRPAENVLTGFDPALRDALQRLPPRQRTALWLHYGEDLSIADVAHVMRISAPAAKQLLFRSRDALRKELADGR